jgi:hypothetical protein
MLASPLGKRNWRRRFRQSPPHEEGVMLASVDPRSSGLAADVEYGFEAVSVKSIAFMILGKARQRMRGFEMKCFLEFDFYFTVPNLSK